MKIKYTFSMLKSVFNFFARKSPAEQLLAAAEKGDAKKTARLLAAGAPVDAGADDLRGTALLRAAGAGHAAVVALLLDAGADVNARDYTGRNALHESIVQGQGDIALMLVLRGDSRYDAADRMQELPMESAIYAGRKDIVLALVAAGADASQKNSHGDSMEELVRRAGWDDAGWQAVMDDIAARRAALVQSQLDEQAARDKYAADLQSAIAAAAQAGADLPATPRAVFKKRDKTALSRA